MKIRIIGKCGPYAKVNEACSCYLLNIGGKNVVLDMGNGSLAKLQNFISMGEIDAIILSHLHFDHISDIFILKYGLINMKNKSMLDKKIKLFMPEEPQSIASLVADHTLFDVTYMKDGLSLDLFGGIAKFRQMTHPVVSYGVSIRKDGKKFVYTGDTNYNERLEKFMWQADLLLVDGGLLEQDGGKAAPHLTVKQAAMLGHRAEAKQTVITHLSPLYTYDQIREECISFPNALVANEFDQFTVE